MLKTKPAKAKAPKSKKSKTEPVKEIDPPVAPPEEPANVTSSNDQPPELQTETRSESTSKTTGNQTWTMTADQSRTYRSELLQAIARQDGGVISLADLAAWGAQQSVGWHPEVMDLADAESLIDIFDDRILLVGAGWQFVLKVREDKAAAAAARQQEIINAHTEYAKGEQALLIRRQAAAREIDEVKGILNSKKLALQSVEDEIAAYIAQGPQLKAITGAKQESLFDLPGVMPKPDQSGIAAEWRKLLPGVENDRVIVYDASKAEDILPSLEEVVSAIISPLVFEANRRAIDDFIVVQVCGHPHIVSACWTDQHTHEGRANVIRLYSMAEWADLFANQLGAAVVGHDATDEGRDKRQREGAWCGLVVYVNNKPYVVGPQSHAHHIVYLGPAATAAPQETITETVDFFDGKAAAAGDNDEPEDVVLPSEEPAIAPAEDPNAVH
jgi:hypothetical protein